LEARLSVAQWTPRCESIWKRGSITVIDRGGFFVRDVAINGDFISVGGTLSAGSPATQAASVNSIGVNFAAAYEVSENAITITATVTSTTGTDRALSIGFALPVNALVQFYDCSNLMFPF
jgi:hypothetical protein